MTRLLSGATLAAKVLNARPGRGLPVRATGYRAVVKGRAVRFIPLTPGLVTAPAFTVVTGRNRYRAAVSALVRAPAKVNPAKVANNYNNIPYYNGGARFNTYANGLPGYPTTLYALTYLLRTAAYNY
jgi:hypothetical protein